MNLEGKIAVITGATGGIGLEIVRELDRGGVRCVLISRTEDKLKDLFLTLKTPHGKYYACDFGNTSEVVKLAKTILSDVKHVDILINAVGVGVYSSIEDVTEEDWDTTFDIGVKSPYFLIKNLAAGMLGEEESLVLNIGSGAGVMPMAGRSVYSASKFALRGMTLSLAQEFKGTNTRFSLMTLGSTLTEFGPLSLEDKKSEMDSGKAYFTPEWVAKKVSEIIKEKEIKDEYTFFPSDYKEGWAK